MVILSYTNKIASICGFTRDFNQIPTLIQIGQRAKDGSRITGVQVRESTNSVSACEFYDLSKLFADDLTIISSMPEERGISRASKNASIARAVALSANKLTNTINMNKKGLS